MINFTSLNHFSFVQGVEHNAHIDKQTYIRANKGISHSSCLPHVDLIMHPRQSFENLGFQTIISYTDFYADLVSNSDTIK